MRQPSLFISHGSPMEIMQNSATHQFWQKLPELLPEKPRAVLCISAHWDAPHFMLSGVQGQVGIQHDFYGFPEQLYELDWPLPNDSDTDIWMMHRIQALGVRADRSDRPLDHGVWVPLMTAWPRPDFPVYQLSLSLEQGLDAHWEVGQKLAAMRDEGILIIGSGGITHNLRMLDRDDRSAPPAKWADEFVQVAEAAIADSDRAKLITPWQMPYGRQCHPTVEHYAPLLVAMGAANGEKVSPWHHEWSYGSLAVHTYGTGR